MPRRGEFEARLLERTAWMVHAQHGKRKQAIIGAMSGTIVELGPGVGANIRYYAPGVEVIAIEPNPAMHERLLAEAAEHDVSLDLRELRGEQLPFDDDSVDGVVATLVLCSVDDPAAVLSEVRRVLRPGGTLFFLDHVAAPRRSMTRLVQRLAKYPHRWWFSGCEVDRDTETTLHDAGFADVSIERVDSGWRGAYIRHQIIGTATV